MLVKYILYIICIFPFSNFDNRNHNDDSIKNETTSIIDYIFFLSDDIKKNDNYIACIAFWLRRFRERKRIRTWDRFQLFGGVLWCSENGIKVTGVHRVKRRVFLAIVYINVIVFSSYFS